MKKKQMEKEHNAIIRLNTTLNMGHLIFSSVSLLIVIITMWVNVNVRLARLEYDVDTQKQNSMELKMTQEKLFQQLTRTNADMTRLLYEIKLELKDKEDRMATDKGN
ncbi:hypothetical protein [Fulvivirga kasyanovii]|uniref:S-adenosyl-methyltransferase n=2 Tax=Cytophagales TaxID=768507 RepID=A0ABW9RLN1_9BACT|nr:hypothetical protein [Fulvivirga kasyanovii]MTI24273.1 hypothetical protein [Fulvivirga kasyanovii]HNP17037.1 hypothetical protein [Fulvivirga sp.]